MNNFLLKLINKYYLKKNYVNVILIILFIILVIYNIRIIKYETMVASYKLYSLYGNIAWNNKYPIDLPI